MTSKAGPSAGPRRRRDSWPQYRYRRPTTTEPDAPLVSPRPRPFLALVNALEFITFCLLVSVFIAILLRYMAQPSAVPLPIHRPIAQLPSTLRSFIPPPTSYGHPTSYIPELKYVYEYGIQDLCHYPLKWIRERKRYWPDAGGLYDHEIWADAPKDAPGKLYPLDEVGMDELGRFCEATLDEARTLRVMSREIMHRLEQAHKDSVETIYSIATHLAKLHRQLSSRNKTSSDDDLVLFKYLSELNALGYAEWVEKVSVLDPSLPKSGQYRRKNHRAFETEEVTIRRSQLKLYSLEMLASQLSDFSDLALLLNSHITTLVTRLKPLIIDRKNKKQMCLTGWFDSLPPLLLEAEDASRLASDQAGSLRQSISQVDALRLSLGGFLRGGNKHNGGYEMPYEGHIRQLSLVRNDTVLQGDHWQATWAWMELDTRDWATSRALSTWGAMVANLRKLLPRHPIRLPPIERQYKALRDAFNIAGKEMRDWVSLYPHQLSDLNQRSMQLNKSERYP
ncbi:uncharacterized protein NECHADRAFT_88842 [Fusarium vanettenii 77-13-4]|uniref:Uncharacterized protein n=1 Tax=Fusarium vanettenii (strain ATCC MYA-4622 / CBS 123669 / FGSC 9596 / NRRL 45880 / 77-13-4) TaxID=660122 RepID=C7ZN62_FUSV7|nr:uncharacterized protein NECHADRAFT_88842 [Fusarium vanettenii 77-13-4]EEU34548.1 predicted protein [Fusarium vanettenii 77-13-4]